jgi:hypothetical protein
MTRSTGATTVARARATIIGDHAVLRAALDELDALLEALPGDGHGDGARSDDRVREHARALFERFGAHLDLEEDLLVEPLRAIEAGAEWVERLLAEHAEQREQVAALLARLADRSRSVSTLAPELRGFVHLVRIDMEHEEVTILREGLLLDD